MIAPWHPGFGHSERPKGFTKIDDLAYFYLDLAEHYDLNNAVLAGASFGGWIAMEMAVRSTCAIFAPALSAPLGFKAGDRETRDIFDLYLSGRPIGRNISSPTSRCCRIIRSDRRRN